MGSTVAGKQSTDTSDPPGPPQELPTRFGHLVPTFSVPASVSSRKPSGACSAALHVLGTFSDPHILRSPAHRTAPAISLSSPSNLTGHRGQVSPPSSARARARTLPRDSPVQPAASGTAAGPPPPPGDQSREARCSSGCCRIPPGPARPARAPSAPHLKLRRTPPARANSPAGPRRPAAAAEAAAATAARPGVPARRPRVLAPLPASVRPTPRMPAI